MELFLWRDSGGTSCSVSIFAGVGCFQAFNGSESALRWVEGFYHSVQPGMAASVQQQRRFFT